MSRLAPAVLQNVANSIRENRGGDRVEVVSITTLMGGLGHHKSQLTHELFPIGRCCQSVNSFQLVGFAYLVHEISVSAQETFKRHGVPIVDHQTFDVKGLDQPTMMGGVK